LDLVSNAVSPQSSLQILFRPFYHGTLPEIYLKFLAFSSSMQRRTVPMNGPAQGDLGEVHEVVNLLQTDVRAEYQKPPLHSRIKSFMLQNYTPAHLLPVIKWLPAYAGKGPGGWRENLYSDVFAGCTVAYVPVPARRAQCGGCARQLRAAASSASSRQVPNAAPATSPGSAQPGDVAGAAFGTQPPRDWD
jgi:hypothetical protein